MEAGECIPELHAARPSCHSAKARTVPVDFSAFQNQTGRWFRGWKFHTTWQFMILLGDEEHLVFAVLDVAGRSGHCQINGGYGGGRAKREKRSEPSGNTERPGTWARGLMQPGV